MTDSDNFQSQLVHEVMGELANHIDNDVMWDLLYKDDFPYSSKLASIAMRREKERNERVQWLDDNCPKQWKEHYGKIYFMKQEQLVLYLLRWS